MHSTTNSSLGTTDSGSRQSGRLQGGHLRRDVLQLEEALRRLTPSEVKRMRQLEDENSRLKKIVADLTLDKAMLQDFVRRKL